MKQTNTINDMLKAPYQAAMQDMRNDNEYQNTHIDFEVQQYLSTFNNNTPKIRWVGERVDGTTSKYHTTN